MQDEQQFRDESSLEAPSPPSEVIQPGSSSQLSPTPEPGLPQNGSDSPNNKPSPTERIRRLVSHLNIYIIIFIALLLVFSVGIYTYNKISSQKTTTGNSSNTGNKLTDSSLQQLQNSDVKIGDPKQVLGIESNTIFAGKVLVRDSLEVAGSIKVGGNLSLAGLTVAGTSAFDQIQTNSIAISQNAAIQGQLTVQRTLNVAGGGSFGGALSAPQITVDSLQLNRDLQISHHIDPTGATPTKSDGASLGSGGTSSISGTDIAGTVVINTGGSPPAGCFMTVNFRQRFTGTPHISLTPASTAAASINYYVSRSATNFSICTANSPSAGQNYVFDYIAID